MHKEKPLKIVNTVAGIIYLTKRQPLTTMIARMVREGWDPPSKNLRFHSQISKTSKKREFCVQIAGKDNTTIFEFILLHP